VSERRRAALALAVLALACAPARPELVRMPVKRPEALLLRDVAVLDVATGVRTPGRDVLVRGDRIEAIEPTGALAPPAGAEVVEGQGGTLLPGLVDMHGHVMSDPSPPWSIRIPDPDAVLRAFLYCGVTTVLDPADSSPEAFARRERVADGTLPGPSIFSAGLPLTAPGGHPIGFVRLFAPWWIAWYVAPRSAAQVETPEQAQAAAEANVRAGADFIKLMVDHLPDGAPRIGVAEMRAAVEAAHARGVRAVAHIGTLEDARDAARAGVDAWVHGVYRERISDEAVAELARFGIPMVPTLTVFDSYAHALDGQRPSTQLEREIAPPELLASFDQVPPETPQLDVFRPFLERLHEERESGRDNARRLHEAGVPLFAGSDPQSGVFPGAGLHRELAQLASAGLTPIEVIRAATLAPARFLARSDDPDFGQVAVGKRADLLLVAGDPTQDVAALDLIREVIVRGARVERIPVSAQQPY
jgi:imidazolonepropionase-like amidohydrolase